MSSADAALENTSLLLSAMRQFVMEMGPALKRQKRSPSGQASQDTLYAPWNVRFIKAITVWMEEAVMRQAEGDTTTTTAALWLDCASSKARSELVSKFMLSHFVKNPTLENVFRTRLSKTISNKKMIVKDTMCLLILKYPKIQQAVNNTLLDSCVNNPVS